MKLSIVTTMYRSRDFLREFHRRVAAGAAAVTSDFEIIYVNDGSPDDSLAIARTLHDSDARVVLVDLSRNFGHHQAMMEGLRHATGDRIFLIDVDLEEDPEYLIEFNTTLGSEDVDVIYGVQAERRGNVFEVVSGNIFYWLMERLGGIVLPRNLTTMRLMTRRYVDSLLRHGERQMIIAALWQATGYKQLPRTITKRARTHSSNYNIMRRIKLAVDHLTVSTNNLLYYVLYFGIAVFALSLLVASYAIVTYLSTANALSGWTSIIASVWMFGGLSVLLIGLVGIYVARIFEETKQRPTVIVREVLRSGGRSTVPSVQHSVREATKQV